MTSIKVNRKPMPLIPETNDEPPSRLRRLFSLKRSIVWRGLKNPYAPIVITFIGLFLSVGTLKAHIWLTEAFYKEKVISVAPIGIRTAKAAEVTPKDIANMTTEEYIRYVFGKDAPTALLVANGEGLNHPCDGFNTNTNRTIDVGPFRINSVHFKKPGVNIVTMSDCFKNVDFAYKLYKEQGWCPWVAYKKLYPNKCK